MRFHTTLLLGSAGIALQWSVAAFAADAPSGPEQTSPSTVADLTVTARRVAEDAQKIPVAVSVVTAKALADRNVRTIEDLQTALPGVQIADNSDNPSGAAIEIRGQGAPDDLVTTDPAVGIYYDGVYLPRDSALKYILQDPDEIGQVEVLRGPQGTLFGRNTTGGAFNITSKAPSPDFGAYGQAIVGNYGLWDATVGANLPLGDDAGLRIGYEHGQHGGYGRDSVGVGLQSETSDFFHARLSATAGDRLTIDAGANYLKFTQGEAILKFAGFDPASLSNPATAQTAGGVIADVLVESGLAPTPANFPTGIGILQSFTGGSLYQTGGKQDVQPNAGEFFNADLTMSYRLNDLLTLKSITGVVTTRRTGTLDLDGTPFHLITVGEFTDSRAWSEELQGIIKAGPIDGVVGAYFFNETGEDDTFAAALGGLGVAPFVYDGVADNKSQAIFGQFNWHATDKLTITGGLRYTWDSKGLTSFNHTGGTMLVRQLIVPTNPLTGVSTAPGYSCIIAANLQNVAPGLCEANFVNKYSALTWTGSASYQFTDDILGYLKASRGYRGGGENLRGGALTFTAFLPEFATQYEVGLKSTFWDRRAQLNVAAFYTDYSNIQLSNIITVVVGGSAISGTTILNAGKANLEGIEVEGTVIPVDHLTLGVVADWFHGKYAKYNFGGVDETSQPWDAPNYTVDLLGRYEIPLSFGSIAGQADYFLRDRVPLSLGSVTACAPSGSSCVYDAAHQVVWGPTLGLLSARLTLHVDAWKADFSLWGRNLTDQHYFTSLLGAVDVRVFKAGYVADPLTFGVEVRKAF